MAPLTHQSLANIFLLVQPFAKLGEMWPHAISHMFMLMDRQTPGLSSHIPPAWLRDAGDPMAVT